MGRIRSGLVGVVGVWMAGGLVGVGSWWVWRRVGVDGGFRRVGKGPERVYGGLGGGVGYPDGVGGWLGREEANAGLAKENRQTGEEMPFLRRKWAVLSQGNGWLKSAFCPIRRAQESGLENAGSVEKI